MAYEIGTPADNYLVDGARAVTREAERLSAAQQAQLGIVAVHARKWLTVTTDRARIAVLEERTRTGRQDVLARITWPATDDPEPTEEYFLTLARIGRHKLPERWLGIRGIGQAGQGAEARDAPDPLGAYSEARSRLGEVALSLAIARLSTEDTAPAPQDTTLV